MADGSAINAHWGNFTGDAVGFDSDAYAKGYWEVIDTLKWELSNEGGVTVARIKTLYREIMDVEPGDSEIADIQAALGNSYAVWKLKNAA